MVPVYCITLDINGKRAQRTLEEFRPYGVEPVLFRGIDNKKWTLKTTTEMHHDEGFPYFIDWRATGCYLSHWMLWNHLYLSKVNEVMIVEDDVRLCVNFAQEFARSYAELPSDWQYAFVGSCCAGGRPTTPVSSRVFDVRWPMCTHCYLLKFSSLEPLLDNMAECRAPVDIAIHGNVFAKGLVKAYTFLPRLADQHETVLHP